MRIAILKHLQNLEAMVDRLDRKPIMLLDIDAFDPVDRDAYLDGDDSILTKYGFEPSPSHLAAIVISTHPAQRESWDEISDLD